MATMLDPFPTTMMHNCRSHTSRHPCTTRTSKGSVSPLSSTMTGAFMLREAWRDIWVVRIKLQGSHIVRGDCSSRVSYRQGGLLSKQSKSNLILPQRHKHKPIIPDLQSPGPQHSGLLVLGHVPCCDARTVSLGGVRHSLALEDLHVVLWISIGVDLLLEHILHERLGGHVGGVAQVR